MTIELNWLEDQQFSELACEIQSVQRRESKSRDRDPVQSSIHGSEHTMVRPIVAGFMIVMFS